MNYQLTFFRSKHSGLTWSRGDCTTRANVKILVALCFILNFLGLGPGVLKVAAHESFGSTETSLIAKVPPKKSTKPKLNSKKKNSNLERAWKLSQSSNMVGPIKIVVSKSGVRLNASKMGLLWIFTAPSWDAYIYNVETKNYCSFKYEEWKKRGFFMPGARRNAAAKTSLKKMKVKKTGKSMNMANIKVSQVEFYLANGTKYGEFWVTKKIVVPVQFEDVVANMLKIPSQSGGVPLKVIMRNRRSKLVPVLETQKAECIKVGKDLYKPLKGYKKVKDEMALLFADSSMFGGNDIDTTIGD